MSHNVAMYARNIFCKMNRFCCGFCQSDWLFASTKNGDLEAKCGTFLCQAPLRVAFMILTLTTVVVYVEQKRNIDIGQFLLFLNLKRCDFFLDNIL